MPSVLLRGNATNPAGTLSTGRFAGGTDGNFSNAGWRNSYDVQVLWELQGLGFGNRAAVKEREADNRAALLELFRVQDRVAAEVVQAHSQVRRASAREVLQVLRSELQLRDAASHGKSRVLFRDTESRTAAALARIRELDAPAE